MFGLSKKPAAPQPTAQQLVPRIKHLNFLTTVQQIAAKEPASLPLTRPLVADLLVSYAFDLPGAFMMAREVDRQRLKLSLDQIHATAVTNLRRQLPRVKQKGTSPLFMFAVGNNLDACLLLFEEVWRKTIPNVPGKIVVAVPTRDIVLFTSSEWPEGLTRIGMLSTEARKHNPVHSLSEHLLTWSQGEWSIFQ
jgi:uncharacterized protein YtpQ (UPF0354 family)